MRSPLLALALLLGVSGGVEAATCVVVKDTGERYAGIKVARPDLVGQQFTVTRRTSQRKDEYVPSREVTYRTGYEGYELAGKAGTFLVRRDYVVGTPAVAPVSFDGGSINLIWDTSAASRKVRADDYILDGPLAALTLSPTRCR